ncbi:hexosaminidase [Chitinophaga costaii]|uniref:beta-N-acetylhexosaminidase n=1 Tax=Chitinophaga costaii TaxID=1335309 RepID=A0A1C4EJH4_9BACT|nr:family 20 glycosylhydrolase [Chitinophaga costaii]PUZ23779.1 beta-hexosaminidase [Chitinophaga costaii]SCC43707.1 hexosaminidase [Chitinophaga costaii]
MKRCYIHKFIYSITAVSVLSFKAPAKALLTALLLFLSWLPLQAQSGKKNYNIIPYPAKLLPQPGVFTINSKTTLATTGDAFFANEITFLTQLMQHYLGAGALQTKSAGKFNVILLKQDGTLPNAEAYTISISPQQIILTAKEAAGMFYAIETLRQLLPADVETGKGNVLTLPCVQIADQPAFAWRGMMLDVSRHFFSVAYLEKYADMMALYKLNKLHLHLTDDQGWRIAIKKYPRLTSEGAWRTFNNQDSACIKKALETGNNDLMPDTAHIMQKNGQTLYGGFYTQEEMRNFIRYAASRHIEVIPEIDMPGHMMAAARIYPELTCDTLVSNDPHNFSNPICPCNPAVLEFAKDIFTEIAALFPSPYLHIGGDEVNKKNWAQSPLVQAFMKEKGYTDMNQIQSHFNDYMLDFFKSKGKTLLGWDEIIEGGIDSAAVMMFWRAWAPQAPAQAAKNHNKIVMTPDGPLYFDALSDAQTLPAVYHYDPYDSALYHLSPAAQQYIMGLQANLWTEMIPSENRADYMTMPRLTALAEIGWTHRYNYDDYLQRLNAQYDRLDQLNIHYRLPDLDNLAENYAVIDSTSFYVASPLPRFKVHYTLNGALPDATSPVMNQPVVLSRAAVMKLALFTPTGRRGDVYSLNFRTQQLSGQETIPHLKNGLTTELYKGEFPLTSAIKGVPDRVFTIDSIAVPTTIQAPAFGLKIHGYIQVPETGIYTFYLTCNDGGVLYIGKQEIVNNDGLHPDKTKGGQAGLRQGLHPIAVNFIEYGGGYTLGITYSYKGSKPVPVPYTWFKSAENESASKP